MERMTIAEAARAAGITPKMARNYEALGLVRPALRSEAGYRLYGAEDVRTLRLIGRARSLGFGLPRIARILESTERDDVDRLSAEIDAQIDEMDRQLRELTRLLGALRALRLAGAAARAALEGTDPATLGRASTSPPARRAPQGGAPTLRRTASRRETEAPLLCALWGSGPAASTPAAPAG